MSFFLSESYEAVVRHVRHLCADRAEMIDSRLRLAKACESDVVAVECHYCKRSFCDGEEHLVFSLWNKTHKLNILQHICLDRPTCLERERVRQEELAEKVTLPKTKRETEKESFGV